MPLLKYHGGCRAAIIGSYYCRRHEWGLFYGRRLKVIRGLYVARHTAATLAVNAKQFVLQLPRHLRKVYPPAVASARLLR
jgi:hypothetical protein